MCVPWHVCRGWEPSSMWALGIEHGSSDSTPSTCTRWATLLAVSTVLLIDFTMWPKQCQTGHSPASDSTVLGF